MIAKEKLAFTKMKPICELEERHGVDLGAEYKNDDACATFISFIANEQQAILLNFLSKSHFFSLQSQCWCWKRGAGVIFDHLFDAFAKDGIVHICTKLFSARHLSSGTGVGLFASLKAAVEHNEC